MAMAMRTRSPAVTTGEGDQCRWRQRWSMPAVATTRSTQLGQRRSTAVPVTTSSAAAAVTMPWWAVRTMSSACPATKASGFEGYDTYAGGGGDATSRSDGRRGRYRDDAVLGGPTASESIDATGASGPVRVLGDWNANNLDFSGTTLKGNIVINGGGNDTITGSAGDDGDRGRQLGQRPSTVVSATTRSMPTKGNDVVGGSAGDDTFPRQRQPVRHFEGWDKYDGGEGNDRIVAFGSKVTSA